MQEMHDSIAAGDMVITIGGVVGRVVKKKGITSLWLLMRRRK